MPAGGNFQFSWFVVVNGQQHGPVSTDQLIVYLETHDPSQVYVWCDGFADWKLASEVPELAVTSSPPLIAPSRAIPVAQSPIVAAISRKRSWTKIASIIGLALSLLRLFAGDGSLRDPAFVLRYTGGTVIFAAVLGFVFGAIADLFRTKPQKNGVASMPAEKSGRRNIVATHWRGDFPLWISFWILGVLVNIGLGIVALMMVEAFKAESDYNPTKIFVVLALMWSTTILFGTWQFVGGCRSASKYTENCVRAGRKVYWGGLAQVVMILGALGNVVTFFREGAPQLVETARMAFQNDPNIPDYSIRVMRDGTEAEIVGGFKFGLTDDFKKIIGASRRIKVVHLDSIGGRIGEGQKMFTLIRERGLSTYVSSQCLSACTLAFAGGRERYLHKNASLGFHRGAFAGLADDDFDDGQRDVFRAAGFDEEFISIALSTPHKDMWKPTPQVLMTAKVVTAISDGSNFAYSGLGSDLTKEKIAKHLATALPVFDAIRIRYPSQYEAITEQYVESHLKGKTEAETIEAVRVKIMPFIKTLLPLADDDVLVDYNKVLLDQYIELSTRNATYCYLFASGEDPNFNVTKELTNEVTQRELRLLERVVKTARKRAPVDAQLVEYLWNKVFDQMAANGVNDAEFQFFGSTKVPKESHARYCTIAGIYMKEVGGLPNREAAILMREIFNTTGP